MALKYKSKRPVLIDALAVAGISTASNLAAEAKIGESTAQTIFQGGEVSLKVAIEVVHLLQNLGADVAVSTMFDEVSG